jgi:APA family basic amino acid/polyamine antiporter
LDLGAERFPSRIKSLAAEGALGRMGLFTKKPLAVLLAQAEEEGQHSLKRGLGAFNLTTLGIGSVIGAGIFVLTGQAAAQHAGPAIVLSYVLGGIVCAFAALCYAELSAMIPVSGSAYTYAYATLGEFIAWLIAWDLIVEYLFASSTVSVGWSGYFVGLLKDMHIYLPPALTDAPFKAGEGFHIVPTGAILNVPAVLVLLFTAGILIAGITESAMFNNVVVSIKVAVVLLVIVFGFMHVNPANWHPFVPPIEMDPGTHHTKYGLPGIFTAAGVIFFAYIGFETISTAGQEAINPQKNMPIGIIASLTICTILYLLMCLVITGMLPFRDLDVPAPVYAAVDAVGPSLAWLKPVVTIGATIGLFSTMLSLLYGQSRIFYAMGRDGLLPAVFAKVHSKRRTPWFGTLITASAAALMGGLFPIGLLGELVSVGTLLAFSLICAGVIYLRIKEPDMHRPFKTPFWKVTAPLGVVSCLYLVMSLPMATFVRLLVWMAIGLVVYFGYAYKHSKYRDGLIATKTVV